MKNALYLVALSLLFSSCGSTTQSTTKTTQKIADPSVYANTITEAELKTMLYTYASDEFEGRDTGAPGQKMAVNYIRDHYIKDGVSAAKKDGDYFQNVPLQVLGKPDVTLNVNGTDYTYIDDLVSVGAGNTQTIKANEIVYAGFGFENETYSSYDGLDVKNKIVVIKSGEPQNADGTYLLTGTTESSEWSEFRTQFAKKRDIAKEKGAKAVLFYYPEVYKMAAFRFGNPSGRMTLDVDSDEMYYFMINTDLAKSLVSDIDTNNTAKIIKSDLTLNFTNNSEQVVSENVAAVIKGSEKPNEYIVISAHLDHEGVKDGEIYNGADDDGSGTVAVLEIAQAFAKAKADGFGPKRSIVFLNVTAEEKGLLGSSYYTDYDPIFPLANTVANLNIDMIGRIDPKREKKNRDYLYLIGSDKLSTELHEISENVNTKY
ncbi:MAG: M28 family peptidase, partial [Bizionia sp.]|nr:M28 family peptidase [Bizionia sp.]